MKCATEGEKSGSKLLERLSQFEPVIGSDFEVVREALKGLRDIGRMFRYGGLGRTYLLALAALEALDRIEQPELFGMEGERWNR